MYIYNNRKKLKNIYCNFLYIYIYIYEKAVQNMDFYKIFKNHRNQ